MGQEGGVRVEIRNPREVRGVDYGESKRRYRGNRCETHDF